MGQAFFYDMNLNGKPDINAGGTGFCIPGQCAPGQVQSSNVERYTEYDPDWDPRGVQAFTSLGLAGRAPLIFIDDPTINRVPPKPGILGTAAGYHGMGRITSYDDAKQVELGDFPGGLKDVATENPIVRATMVDAYARWVEETDLDGFRIDTVKHVEHEFWRVFSQAVRQRLAAQGKQKFLLFGEAFDGNDQLLGSYTKKGELDSVFYFSQHFQVFHDVFALAKQRGQAGTKKIEELWAQRAANYGTEAQDQGIGVAPTKALVNFMDNHDRPRFLWDAKGDVPALRNALTFLMAEDGIPCVYYGTELDFAGGNDPANREVYWSANPGWRTDGDTFRHMAKVARVRKGQVALRRGDQLVRFATTNTGAEADAGMFAVERSGGDAGQAIAIAVFNTHATKTSTASFNVGALGRGKTFVDAMGVVPAPLSVPASGDVTVSLPAQSAAIFVVQ
jgi:glycosidase